MIRLRGVRHVGAPCRQGGEGFCFSLALRRLMRAALMGVRGSDRRARRRLSEHPPVKGVRAGLKPKRP